MDLFRTAESVWGPRQGSRRSVVRASCVALSRCCCERVTLGSPGRRTDSEVGMALRLRVPAAASVAAVLRAPCACPVLGVAALASRTPVAAALRRGFATQRSTHVKYSDKKRTIPVILLQDCNLGRVGDEVQVTPGYMRNYLYERRVAVYSTPENKRNHFVPRTTQDRAEFLRPARVAAALSTTPLVRASGGVAPPTVPSRLTRLALDMSAGNVPPRRAWPAAPQKRSDGRAHCRQAREAPH